MRALVFYERRYERTRKYERSGGARQRSVLCPITASAGESSVFCAPCVLSRAACIFTRLEDDTAFARIKPRLHTLETINENSKKPHRGNPPTTQEQRPNRDMPSKRSFSAFTKHCLTCVRKSKPRSPTGPTQSAWTATMRTSVSDSISPRIFMRRFKILHDLHRQH